MPTFADKPTLVGERVILRPITADDAASMWADLHDPEARRLTGTHAVFTREQIDVWAATRADQSDRLDLAVIDRATGEWAGELAVNSWDPDNRCCGFRIALTSGARGRGIGTEATQLVVDHLFGAIDHPPVHRIELEVYAFNTRAIATYERVGFVREGVRRQSLWWDGEFHDTVVMGMVRGDR